jgi:hypothetical protein
MVDTKFVTTIDPCGSGLAREEALTVTASTSE